MFNTKKPGPISTFFGGILFSAIGIGMVYMYGWPEYQDAKKTVTWPKTTGTILNSQVVRSRKSNNEVQYSPDIVYSYVVHGRKLHSTQIYIGSEGTSSGGSKNAHKYVSNYPIGQSVVVYYSPDDSLNAVLDPGVKMEHYYILGIGGLFALIGLGMVFTVLFKLLFITVLAGVAVSSIFTSKQKKNHRSLPLKHSHKIPVRSYKKSSQSYQTSDINLDDEMFRMNQVSSSNNTSAAHEPWKHNWIIKISDKKYGPYPFEKVVSYFQRGKVKENHECYPAVGGNMVKIRDIVHRRAG